MVNTRSFKTNKTKEQAWVVEPDMNWTTKEIFYRGWERALASVVEESVLTRGQALTAIIEWETSEPREMNDGLLDRLFSAGRIPASKRGETHEWDSVSKEEMWNTIQSIRKLTGDDGTFGGPENLVKEMAEELNRLGYKGPYWSDPTPQQEGGLTLDWLTDAISSVEWKDLTQAILARHTHVLEAKEAEVQTHWAAIVETEQLEVNRLAREYGELVALLETEHIEVNRLARDYETLRAELAEAKKGRYAIGQIVEARITAREINGTRNNSDGADVRPQSPTPTIEQMATELVDYWLKDVSDVIPLLRKQMAETMTHSPELESLWRRDCKGGVK